MIIKVFIFKNAYGFLKFYRNCVGLRKSPLIIGGNTGRQEIAVVVFQDGGIG
jgi:hypothetical protein